jgi:hypothetical protein
VRWFWCGVAGIDFFGGCPAPGGRCSPERGIFLPRSPHGISRQNGARRPAKNGANLRNQRLVIVIVFVIVIFSASFDYDYD